MDYSIGKCSSTILIMTDIHPAVVYSRRTVLQMLPLRIFITESQTIFHKTVMVRVNIFI